MTNLEEIFRDKYADLLGSGKKKKPKKDLLAEDDRLRQKYRDLGIDLGEPKELREEDDDLRIRLPKKKGKYGELEDLGSSVGLLSKYLIKKLIKDNIYENKNIILKNNKYFDLKKEFKEEIIKNYNILNIISNNFSKIQSTPLGLNLTLGDSASINADNIGEFALPIVEYIHQTQPDFVVASDRGARLLGLAVFRLHKRLYGRFPTADGTIRFRRFSKSNTQEATEKHIQPLVDEILACKKKPTVLVLDDWVCSGGTKRLAQNVLDKLGKGKIKIKFGVLVGAGADVSGHSGQTSGFAGVTDWRDYSDIIGVRYGKDNWGSTGIKAQPVRSEQARDYRKRMYEGIDKLVDRIAEEGKEAVMAKH
ncbi:hypothetical protein J4217_01660 [Candidatus Pacearchaeota archaeon]|nr:hypothetical protein [Candidatus Pacearchaeota archaeon]